MCGTEKKNIGINNQSMYRLLRDAYEASIADFFKRYAVELEKEILSVTEAFLSSSLCSQCKTKVYSPSVRLHESRILLNSDPPSYVSRLHKKSHPNSLSRKRSINDLSCSDEAPHEMNKKKTIPLPNLNTSSASQPRIQCMNTSHKKVTSNVMNLSITSSNHLLMSHSEPSEPVVDKKRWVTRCSKLKEEWENALNSRNDNQKSTQNSSNSTLLKSPLYKKPDFKERQQNGITGISLSTRQKETSKVSHSHKICAQCEDFYNTSRHSSQEPFEPKFSRHNFFIIPPSTPAGFWDVNFPKTPP